MKLKTTLAVMVLVCAPALVSAQCMGDHRMQTAMSCAEGMTLDSETGTCVPVPTG